MQPLDVPWDKEACMPPSLCTAAWLASSFAFANGSELGEQGAPHLERRRGLCPQTPAHFLWEAPQMRAQSWRRHLGSWPPFRWDLCVPGGSWAPS